MANKKRKQLVQAPRQMTRGQLSRHQRELQRTRRFTMIMGGIGLLVILILLVAIVSTYVIKPNTEVGKVNGETITRATYNKFRSWQIYDQMRLLDFYAQQSQSTQQQQYQTQITQLQQELQTIDQGTWPAIDSATLSQLADNVLVAQKAGPDLGVTVSDADVLAAAKKNFEPQPTPIPGPSDTPGPTNTPGAATATGTPPTDTPTVTGTATHTPTPGPSPTSTRSPTVTSTPLPVPGAEKTAEADYGSFIKAISGNSKPTGSGFCALGCPGLSSDDYLRLVARPDELKTKVTEKLAKDVPTTQDEVHAQHILVADEALAKQIKDQLDKGADFAALAAQYSTDKSNKDQGGDLGWFAPTAKGGTMVQEFSDAAFALTKPGQISAPVKSQFGWHIIRLIERGPQPLSQTDLDKAKSTAFDDWLKKEKDKSSITLQIPATATPFPTQPPLPTVPPLGTTPPITGTGTLTGTGPITGTGTLTGTSPITGTGKSGVTPVPGTIPARPAATATKPP